MSLFDQNTIQKADEWAFEQLYDVTIHIKDDLDNPCWITRRSDGVTYRSIRSLFSEYLYECSRIRSIEDKLNFPECYHSRRVFENYIFKNCKDRIEYHGNLYFNVVWFREEFIYDIFKHYFEI